MCLDYSSAHRKTATCRLLTKSGSTARKCLKRNNPVFVAFVDLDKAFECVDHISMLDSLISLGISGRIITYIYLVLISHGSNPADKLQKVLNAVDKTAITLGLYFSPAKTKTIAFNASRESHKFKLGLQYLEMVNNYKHLGITIDRRHTFAGHVAETRRKIYSRFNMIMAINNLKIGVNTKMLITLYKSLVQSVLLYAAPVLLLAGNSALQFLEIIKRVPLRYILWLPNDTSSILVYRESGILPIRLLIKRKQPHIS